MKNWFFLLVYNSKYFKFFSSLQSINESKNPFALCSCAAISCSPVVERIVQSVVQWFSVQKRGRGCCANTHTSSRHLLACTSQLVLCSLVSCRLVLLVLLFCSFANDQLALCTMRSAARCNGTICLTAHNEQSLPHKWAVDRRVGRVSHE